MIRVLSSVLCVMIFLWSGARAASAEKRPGAKGASVKIAHIQPALKYPGELMTLIVTLKGTKDSERRLRAFIVRDGQILDLSLPSAQYNQQEEPYYEVPVYAPEGELLYLFLLYNPDGTVTASDRFYVRRPCLPSTDLASGKIDNSLQPDVKLKELVQQADDLSRDIKSYETILSMLKELYKMIGEK